MTGKAAARRAMGMGMGMGGCDGWGGDKMMRVMGMGMGWDGMGWDGRVTVSVFVFVFCAF